MTRLNTLTGPQLPKTNLRLDWKGYFRKFVGAHGEPVNYDGRLLFRDGWQYSITDYQGPEYAPPEDSANLRGLKLTYWRLLRDRLKQEATFLTDQIGMLTEWQNNRAMPLQQVVTYLDTESIPYIWRIKKYENMHPSEQNLDLSGLKANLDDREHFLKEAQNMLDELLKGDKR